MDIRRNNRAQRFDQQIPGGRGRHSEGSALRQCRIHSIAMHVDKVVFQCKILSLDILLVDRVEEGTPLHPELAELLANWHGPLLYNDAIATEVSLQQGNPDFGQSLAERIYSLADASIHTGRVEQEVHIQ